MHETPDYLLEKRQFEKAVKAMEFYKTDPKLIVDDEKKRLDKDGKTKGYKELVGFYRKESVKDKKARGVYRKPKTHLSLRYS